MKRTLIKKFIYCLFIASILFVITSCTPDMGVYNKEDGGFDDYYGSFDDIVGIYDGESQMEKISYDIKDSITNDYTIENLSWENSEKKVVYKQYIYIVIPFKRDLKVESLALFVNSDPNIAKNTGISLEFSAFYFKDSSSCPDESKLKKSTDPDDGTEYSDPLKEARVAAASLRVSHEFDSFLLDGFHQTVDIGESYVSDKCLLAKEDSFLFIRVENNSSINKDMTPVDISFISLLVRAV